MQHDANDPKGFIPLGPEPESSEIRDLMLREIFEILPKIDQESFLVKLLNKSEFPSKYEIIGQNYKAIHTYLKALDGLKDYDANEKQCIAYDSLGTGIYNDMTIREFKKKIDEDTFKSIYNKAGYDDYSFDNSIGVANSILKIIESHSDNTTETGQPSNIGVSEQGYSSPIEISSPAIQSGQILRIPLIRTPLIRTPLNGNQPQFDINPQFSPVVLADINNPPPLPKPVRLDDRNLSSALLPIPKKLNKGERSDVFLNENLSPVIFDARISDQVFDNTSLDILPTSPKKMFGDMISTDASSYQHSPIETDDHSDDSFVIPPPPPRVNIAGGIHYEKGNRDWLDNLRPFEAEQHLSPLLQNHNQNNSGQPYQSSTANSPSDSMEYDPERSETPPPPPPPRKLSNQNTLSQPEGIQHQTTIQDRALEISPQDPDQTKISSDALDPSINSANPTVTAGFEGGASAPPVYLSNNQANNQPSCGLFSRCAPYSKVSFPSFQSLRSLLRKCFTGEKRQ